MAAAVAAEINLGAVTNIKQMHSLFADAFHFPSYYGANWDAFWDCLRDPEQSKVPPKVVFRGWSRFAERFPRDARILSELIEEAKGERPEIEIVVG